MSVRSMIAPFVLWGTYVSHASTLLAKARRVPRFLMYHGIGGAKCSLSVFEKQMRYLARHFEVVSVSALLDRLPTAAGRSGREVAITIDDGLRNAYTHAYPVLRRLGLPATFFLCPSLIDTARWMWNDEARARLGAIDSARRESLYRSIGAPAGGIERVIFWMKTIPVTSRRATEEAIRAKTPDFRPTEEQRFESDMMSWDEVAGLDPSLITIGSHSSTHPILPSLGDEELEAELAGSRAALERRLGRTVDLFCYPNGSHDARVVEGAGRSYRAAFTTVPAFAATGTDAHRVPRIHSGPDMPLFAWRLYRPEL